MSTDSWDHSCLRVRSTEKCCEQYWKSWSAPSPPSGLRMTWFHPGNDIDRNRWLECPCLGPLWHFRYNPWQLLRAILKPYLSQELSKLVQEGEDLRDDSKSSRNWLQQSAGDNHVWSHSVADKLWLLMCQSVWFQIVSTAGSESCLVSSNWSSMNCNARAKRLMMHRLCQSRRSHPSLFCRHERNLEFCKRARISLSWGLVTGRSVAFLTWLKTELYWPHFRLFV